MGSKPRSAALRRILRWERSLTPVLASMWAAEKQSSASSDRQWMRWAVV